MRLLNVKDLADKLNVKPSTIYAWAEHRKIPHYKLNGALRFREEEILLWLDNCKKEPLQDYNISAGWMPGKGGQS